MDNSSPIIPRLEMESLRQIENETDNSLFNIRDVDAQRFLEKSLVLLLTNTNFNNKTSLNNLKQNNSSKLQKEELLKNNKIKINSPKYQNSEDNLPPKSPRNKQQINEYKNYNKKIIEAGLLLHEIAAKCRQSILLLVNKKY
ncbi:hypothetical protein Mgra_00007857 [Meloidogyne graminicola]|uniref:Uncharacterized protein n=1 Tax=Meloidogyne graminicola TaxID=189291 RepID=A0A8S9ZHD2_9BILA|nr:hypothetical protein Mgra_00007857 [Meloidogyne graminicola]